ncbi:hypothetical protein T08_12335 [Trichinella sp. T8]|nr:hypothetical protein T08_12335 [Trichinella sp. T8]
MPLTNIVRVSRHIKYVGKGDLIQWKNQQEFHSSKTYAISSYPKLKSEKLTLGNHHSLYWLATAVVKIPFYFKIRVSCMQPILCKLKKIAFQCDNLDNSYL